MRVDWQWRTAMSSGIREPAILVSATLAVCLLAALDIWGLLVDLPSWSIVLLAGLPFAVLAVRERSLGRVVALGLVVLACLVLPSVRWNSVKSFYINCKSIRRNSPLSEVHEKMKPYYLQRDHRSETSTGESFERAHLTYHPSIDHSADWCVVYTRAGRVLEVDVVPD